MTTEVSQKNLHADVLQEILTRHKKLIAHYLTINFDLFFSKYNSTLILSQSYVTKRQSIKLLGEILLDRSNYNVMTAYVDRGDHLKLCMNLLKDDRKMVQYEGFHVFKVRAALQLSAYDSDWMPGFRREPEEVRRSAEDTAEQSGETFEVSPCVSSRQNR